MFLMVFPKHLRKKIFVQEYCLSLALLLEESGLRECDFQLELMLVMMMVVVVLVLVMMMT